MAIDLNRRAALALAGAGVLTATSGARASRRRDKGGAARLLAGQPPLAAMLSNTRYFEVVSKSVGARFAVWVTTPPSYGKSSSRLYPAVYLPDGNFAAPSTIPVHGTLESDAIHPIEPFVQICVGYVADEAARQLAVRARDLVPPGEPLPASAEQLKSAAINIVKSGALDQAGADLYLYNLLHPAADKFLAFLTEELHPLIATQYKVIADSAGLFGYSYGGLFATYVALARSPLFKRIGAGSPAIALPASRVFGLYQDNLKIAADHSGRMLHMTVNELEITTPTYLQPTIGAGASQFIVLAGQSPLKGLSFTSRIIDYESHMTGYAPSWFSFLRECYSARQKMG